MAIRFENGSWTGIIGDDFTFANVARVAQGYANNLGAGKKVLVGYDTRFQAARFAEVFAKVLASNGLEVQVSKSYLPSSALAFAQKSLSADGAVMFSAGSKSAEYLGIQVLGSTAAIEPTDAKTVDPAQKIATFDIRKAYFESLMEQLDLVTLRGYSGTVYHDSMGGATSGWLGAFAKQAKLTAEVREIHAVPDVTFYGVTPEPIAQNLFTLTTLLKSEEGSTIGIAHNSDGSAVVIVQVGGVTSQIDVPNDDGFLAGLLELQKAAQKSSLQSA